MNETGKGTCPRLARHLLGDKISPMGQSRSEPGNFNGLLNMEQLSLSYVSINTTEATLLEVLVALALLVILSAALRHLFFPDARP
jgi:hypothetical protein